jgi:hypothetical protein
MIGADQIGGIGDPFLRWERGGFETVSELTAAVP